MCLNSIGEFNIFDLRIVPKFYPTTKKDGFLVFLSDRVQLTSDIVNNLINRINSYCYKFILFWNVLKYFLKILIDFELKKGIFLKI